MTALSSLTPAQCLELDAACHEVASTWKWGRVSVVIEDGRPRWIEVSKSRGLGSWSGRDQPAVEAREHSPPGAPMLTG